MIEENKPVPEQKIVNEIHRPPSPPPKEDAVNHPEYYCFGGIETIDYIKAKQSPEGFRGFLKGSVFKYLSREGHKDDAVQDLKKAAWYLNRLIQELDSK